MNEVDKMLENHGWLCDWSVSTAERVEKLLIEQRNLIHEYSMENEKMKQLLKTIYDSDALQDWACERGDDEESIAEMVRKFVKESK